MLDAGVTSAGQPYIILEYVEGEPIVRYCDTHRLDIKARLSLFQPQRIARRAGRWRQGG